MEIVLVILAYWLLRRLLRPPRRSQEHQIVIHGYIIEHRPQGESVPQHEPEELRELPANVVAFPRFRRAA
jgi:hypothetical protein